MVTPVYTSPLNLLQEWYRKEPWKLLVGCIFLNQTQGKTQVKPMIKDFFKRYPTPQDVINADENEMFDFISPLGFGRQRTQRLKLFSFDWLYKQWKDVDELYGIGKYGRDSYEIFVRGNIIVDVTDKRLKAYVEWAQAEMT